MPYAGRPTAMQKIAHLILLLLLSVALPSRASDQDIAALRGKWVAVEASSNGEPPPEGMLEKISLVFVSDSVSIMGGAPIHFKADSSFTPAHIDFLNAHHQVGIYLLNGDLLKICTGQEGDRPTAFTTEKYTDHTYFLLKRVK